MAGQISWNISFAGMDKALSDLKRMDDLIGKISRSSLMGGRGGTGTIATGPGGTVILPSGVTGGGAGGAAAAGVAAGAGAFKGLADSRQRDLETLRQHIRDARAKGLFPTVSGDKTRDQLTPAGRAFWEGKSPPPGSPSYKSECVVSEGGPRPGQFSMAGWQRYGPRVILAKSPLPYRSIYPDQMATGAGGIMGGFQTMGMVGRDIREGLRSTLTNPMKTLGLGITGTGLLGRGALGGMMSGVNKSVQFLSSMLLKLSLFVAGMIAPIYALHKAFQFLSKGVEHLGDVYQGSARTARPARENEALKAAFASIGLRGGEEAAMTALAQFNPKARQTQLPGTNDVIGALRAGQYANLQQIVNMAKQFEEAMKRSEDSAIQLEHAAAANEKISFEGSILSLKWNTLLEQLTAAAYPLIRFFQKLAESVLDMANTLLEFHVWVMRITGHLPTDEPPMTRAGGMKGAAGSFTAWEKMGFVMPGPKPNDHLKTIAENTAATYRAVGQLADAMKQSVVNAGIWSIIHSLPCAPNTP